MTKKCGKRLSINHLEAKFIVAANYNILFPSSGAICAAPISNAPNVPTIYVCPMAIYKYMFTVLNCSFPTAHFHFCDSIWIAYTRYRNGEDVCTHPPKRFNGKL